MKIKTQNILEKIAVITILLSILTVVICLLIIVWTIPNVPDIVSRILATSTVLAITLGILLTL